MIPEQQLLGNMIFSSDLQITIELSTLIIIIIRNHQYLIIALING